MAKPEEMSVTADASEGECQFYFHSFGSAAGFFCSRSAQYITFHFKYQKGGWLSNFKCFYSSIFLELGGVMHERNVCLSGGIGRLMELLCPCEWQSRLQRGSKLS